MEEEQLTGLRGLQNNLNVRRRGPKVGGGLAPNDHDLTHKNKVPT